MTRPQIIIGYARSGVLGRAFDAVGIDAWEVDLEPSTSGYERHLQADIRAVWNIPSICFGVFHPVCTYLTSAAEWAYKDPDFGRYPEVGYHQKVKPGTLVGAARRIARDEALYDLTDCLMRAYPTVVENPVGVASTRFRKPDQVIQPYQFGDDASKATCLWMAGGVPLLTPTHAPEDTGRVVEWPRGSGKMVRRWSNQTDSGQSCLPPTADRHTIRSQTYPGVARAMAEQWAEYIHQLWWDKQRSAA